MSMMMMVVMVMMMKGLSQVKWVRDARSGQTSSGGRQRSAYQQCVQVHHGDMDQHDEDKDPVEEIDKDGSDDDDDVGDCNCDYDDG